MAQMSNFTKSSTMYFVQFVSLNPLIATFHLSSAASLNLGQSQNDVLGNELTLS